MKEAGLKIDTGTAFYHMSDGIPRPVRSTTFSGTDATDSDKS